MLSTEMSIPRWSRVGHERGGTAQHRASAPDTRIPVIPDIAAVADTRGQHHARLEAEFESPVHPWIGMVSSTFIQVGVVDLR